MPNERILYACQEITPYLAESQISTICRNLPQQMQEAGNEIRLFTPKYGNINERRNQLHEVIRLSGMNIIIDDNDHQLILKVASIPGARLQVYFIDNDDFFHRKALVRSDEGEFFEDNDERAIFFARGVLETVKKLRWSPSIIHCHGWMSAIIPALLKRCYKSDPIFKDVKIVISLYDDMFEESLNENLVAKLKLEGLKANELETLETSDYRSLMKFALQFASGVVKVTENLDPEIEEYITSNQIPTLIHPNQENYSSAYDQFYETLN